MLFPSPLRDFEQCSSKVPLQPEAIPVPPTAAEEWQCPNCGCPASQTETARLPLMKPCRFNAGSCWCEAVKQEDCMIARIELAPLENSDRSLTTRMLTHLQIAGYAFNTTLGSRRRRNSASLAPRRRRKHTASASRIRSARVSTSPPHRPTSRIKPANRRRRSLDLQMRCPRSSTDSSVGELPAEQMWSTLVGPVLL